MVPSRLPGLAPPQRLCPLLPSPARADFDMGARQLVCASTTLMADYMRPFSKSTLTPLEINDVHDDRVSGIRESSHSSNLWVCMAYSLAQVL